MRFARLSQLLDYWSVPHFLFGVVVALASLVFSWPYWEAFAGMMVVALLWEYFEYLVRIRERPLNSWADVVLPILAYFLTLILVDRTPLQHEAHVAFFITALILFVLTNAGAWRARIERDQEFQL